MKTKINVVLIFIENDITAHLLTFNDSYYFHYTIGKGYFNHPKVLLYPQNI